MKMHYRLAHRKQRTWLSNQTTDVRAPEPRPIVELPIIRNNALVPRRVSSATRLPCRRRSGSWPTFDIHCGVYLANHRARALNGLGIRGLCARAEIGPDKRKLTGQTA